MIKTSISIELPVELAKETLNRLRMKREALSVELKITDALILKLDAALALPEARGES